MIYGQDPLTQFMTTAEQLEDSGQAQCDACGEWFAPTGEPFHPGCRKQIDEVRIFMSI